MSFSRSKLRRAMVAWGFLLPAMAVLTVFHFMPMVHAFVLAFWEYSPFNPAASKFVGFAHFTRLMGDGAFWDAAINSCLYLLVVPVIIGLSLGLAMLVEPAIPGIGFFRAAFYVPVVTMMVVVALAWKIIFDTDHGVVNEILKSTGAIDQGLPWLTHRAWALWTVMSVTVWKGLGYYMVLFLVGLKAVPVELKEAARIDGATAWGVFRHVTLPCLWPIITLTAVLSSISAIQVFEEIYIMTRGRIGTSTLVIRIFETGIPGYGGAVEMGYACAMGVVLFVALLLFTAINIRMLERMYTT